MTFINYPEPLKKLRFLGDQSVNVLPLLIVTSYRFANLIALILIPLQILVYRHMDSAGHHDVDAVSADGFQPARHRFLMDCGKTPSPPLRDRVIVFNCESKRTEVRSKKEVDKGKENLTLSGYIVRLMPDSSIDLHEGEYQKFRLNPRDNEFVLFVDSET